MQPELPFDVIPASTPRLSVRSTFGTASNVASPTNPASLAPPGNLAKPESRIPNPEYIRHPRARRYVVRVRDDGTVRVTIPRWGSKREARAFAEQQQRWIEREQRRVHEERARPRAALAPDVECEIRARAKHELPARLSELAAQLGVTVARVSVRNQRWRWGSCSRRGHICLNWRLARMPEAVRDYVMIHELMHIRRLDHSPKFWALVARACPGYESARQWLRAHQDILC
jgi:predicted metal-dependent hydrolase